MKWITLSLAAVSTLALGQGWTPINPSKVGQRPSYDSNYLDVIRRVANMTQQPDAQQLVGRAGLNLVNVMWEDTGRYKGSAVGPNISDLTIQVAARNRQGQLELSAMPVIRFPNFSDVTGDLDPEAFTLLVGNERRGARLQRVSLREFLQDPTHFLSNPNSWRGGNRTLLAPRDSKVLVSAQACFLPIPKQGIATFNPVLFNYQSVAGDPAVLTILATREGTSVTVIDNQRDGFDGGAAWGQRLFFNNRGMRASLTGERLSDFAAGGGDVSGGGAGLNMMLIIQVPLKQRNPRRDMPMAAPAGQGGFGGGAMKESAKRQSDTENAVIGHGQDEGPFTEIDNLAIERDPRFPVRVTVQFYKATSTGVISQADVREIKQNIDSVYKLTENVGSLVTGGETGRPTEYWGSKVQPRGWWQDFWRRYEQNTGHSRQEAIRRLREILGPKYEEQPVCDLYLRDVLRKRTGR